MMITNDDDETVDSYISSLSLSLALSPMCKKSSEDGSKIVTCLAVGLLEQSKSLCSESNYKILTNGLKYN